MKAENSIVIKSKYQCILCHLMPVALLLVLIWQLITSARVFSVFFREESVRTPKLDFDVGCVFLLSTIVGSLPVSLPLLKLMSFRKPLWLT